MCGIVGVMNCGNQDILTKMNDSQSHRGPDDSGIWFDEKKLLGLAHKRLSIIDLSSHAKQPMTNTKKTITIVFNGEIYNYMKLRKELQEKGYIFVSKSDTEVLIHLYDEFNHKMLYKLNGIFAFAIWDHLKGELFIARDGFGVKPLYYVQNNNKFLFASELKALLKYPDIDKSLNFQSIHYYLSYLWSPAPYTMLKSVNKLEPGYALMVKDGNIQKKWCFYDLPYGQQLFNSSENEIAINLAGKIKEAVHRQMISDVPVGAFLSGGLDSSSVVAFARQMNPDQKIDCFTIGFKDSSTKFEGFKEDLPYAQKVAKYLGVNLHTITVGAEMVSRIEDMIYFLDEPQADPAPLNALFICELARKHGIKVLLSGAGGDDIFSGYRRHFALFFEKYWSWLPKIGLKTLHTFSNKFPQNNPIGRRLGKAFRYADYSEEERLISYFLWIDENVLRSLYTDDFKKVIRDTDTIDPLRISLKRIPEEKSRLNRMLYLEAKHFLADHNLNYTDKMGMAAGVEVRVPLLDKELVDFATQIPPHLKQKGWVGKYIFKKAMEPYLPHEIIYRPKSGFGAPLRQWIHNDLREITMELLSEGNLKKRGLFKPRDVKKLIDDNYSGRIDAAYTIFSLLCIEWWMRIFLDKS